jgi:hypothetical protein
VNGLHVPKECPLFFTDDQRKQRNYTTIYPRRLLCGDCFILFRDLPRFNTWTWNEFNVWFKRQEITSKYSLSQEILDLVPSFVFLSDLVKLLIGNIPRSIT